MKYYLLVLFVLTLVLFLLTFILFLLADDEHRYNTEWTAVCRGEIDPEDDAEEFRKKADTSVLKEIILGTEVAKALEKI